MSRSKQLSTSGMGHSIQTDNAKLSEKVHLRKVATSHLNELKVLDLFAGENVLWSYFQCSRYYGVEQQKGKGKNLYADNRKVIPTIDLSGFNVIDIDSCCCQRHTRQTTSYQWWCRASTTRTSGPRS